eukprot:UN31339
MECPTATEVCEPWVCRTYCACLFTYATMDALDGKQARRTGSSSPLGLMFDHGCDCINTTLCITALGCVLQMGYTPMIALFWSCGALGFFYTTFEEYYTGMMYLGPINGPTEGLLVIYCALIGTSFQNVDDPFWLQPSITGMDGYRRNHDMLAFIAFTTVATVIGNLFNICTKIRAEKKSASPNKRYTFRVAVTRCILLYVIIGLYFFWVFFSPTKLFERRGLYVLYTLGLLHSKLLLSLMVAHLTDQPFHPL